jgi:hypothetical protein
MTMATSPSPSVKNVVLLLLIVGGLFWGQTRLIISFSRHIYDEDRKSDPDRWYAQNPDLIKTMADKYGIRLLSNTAIPGSIRVSWDVEKGNEALAQSGVPALRDALFRLRCPYGITMLDWQPSMDDYMPKVVFMGNLHGRE